MTNLAASQTVAKKTINTQNQSYDDYQSYWCYEKTTRESELETNFAGASRCIWLTFFFKRALI